MEPLAGHETRSVKSENGKLFAQVCPPHRPSSTDSDWYSVSPGEIDPSTVAVTDFLLQIQESAVAKNQEQSTGNSILTNEKPSPPVEQAKIPSLDVVTGRPKVRRVCHICGRECPSRHKLQRHLSTHTEERPYSCKICGKAFKWTEYLSKHMRTQHHDDNSNPTSKPGGSKEKEVSAKSRVTLLTGTTSGHQAVSESSSNAQANIISQQSTQEQNNHFSQSYSLQPYSNYYPVMPGQNGYNCVPINCYGFPEARNQLGYSGMNQSNLSVTPPNLHFDKNYRSFVNPTTNSTKSLTNSVPEMKCSTCSQTTEIGTNTSDDLIKKSTIEIINLSQRKDIGIQCELGPETLGALFLEEDGVVSHKTPPPSMAGMYDYAASLNEESPNNICKYLCEYQGCCKAYVHRKDLVRHMKVAHHSAPKLCEPCVVETPVKPYVCSVAQCGRSYCHLKDLKRHQRQYHSEGANGMVDSDDPTSRYLCDFDGCAKSYRHKKDLVRHKKLIHQDTTPFPLIHVPDPILIENECSSRGDSDESPKRFHLDSCSEPNIPDILPQTPGLGIGDLSTLNSSTIETVVANMVGADIPLSTIVTLATNANSATTNSLLPDSNTISSLISIDENFNDLVSST